MSKKNNHQAAPKDIPEVLDFMEVKDKYEAFREEYKDVIDILESISAEYNAALEAADKAVRAHGVSCGPFDAYQRNVSYDPVALYDAVGKDRFIELGGQIQTKLVYEVDRARLEAMIAQNRLPADVIDAVRSETVKYRRLKRMELP